MKMGPTRAPLTYSVPTPLWLTPPSGVPVATSPTNTSTLMASRTWVTTGAVGRVRIRLTFVRSRAHSGQRMPTGVGVMHSGQMGRPQEEQETPVSRFGCR
jgi:hypothetical protein